MQGVNQNHRILITTYFNLGVINNGSSFQNSPRIEDKALIKDIAFEFLPDSFKVPMKSNFKRIPMKLSVGQAIYFEGTDIPDIAFSLRVVAGLDKVKVRSSSAQQEYVALATLAQELYGLVSAQNALISAGLPPPKSVLTVGSMFKGSGVFDNVDIEYFGPYDSMGNPQEMEVTFNFIPTQFYDPTKSGSRLGTNLETSDGKSLSLDQVSSAASGSDQQTQSTLDEFLKQSPAGNNTIDGEYIIYLGPR
jgi:hypothetical protein